MRGKQFNFNGFSEMIQTFFSPYRQVYLSVRGWKSKNSDQLIVTLYMYTIYLSLFTQTADPIIQNPFRVTHYTSSFDIIP